jgi:hypothetical protein
MSDPQHNFSGIWWGHTILYQHTRIHRKKLQLAVFYDEKVSLPDVDNAKNVSLPDVDSAKKYQLTGC